MTLILTLGNSEQVIQLSDRRLSHNGALVDDEAAKLGVLICSNARMAFGFSGLARWGSFSTRDWLVDTLKDCAQPSYEIGGILSRLKSRASDTFRTHPLLGSAPRKDKRLSIMFSGYVLLDTVPPGDPHLCGCAILTNFQDFESGQDYPEAHDEFVDRTWTERRPNANEATYIQRIGAWKAMTKADEAALRNLLLEKKPARAIIGKAINLIREMADRPSAQGVIGKQVSVAQIPRNPQESVTTDYHSDMNSSTVYAPDYVIATPTVQAAAKELTIRVEKPTGEGAVTVVKKIPRKRPCPCGSGEKYKYCHGKSA